MYYKMDSLVLFVGLLIVALSNGFIISPEQELTGNRANRDVSQADVPGGPGPVPVAPVVDTETSSSESSSSDSVPSYSFDDSNGNDSFESSDDSLPYGKHTTTDGVSTTIEKSTTEAPSKGTSTESFTKDTMTDVMDIVDSASETIPKFEVGTSCQLYLDGDSKMVNVTFYGEDQNYTVSANVSTSDYTLGVNNYCINITDYKVVNYVIKLNFTIVSEESLYDGHLNGIVESWREWFVEWKWGGRRRKRSTSDIPKWDNDAEAELQELFKNGILKKALEEKQKAGFPSEAPFDVPSGLP